MQLCPRPCLSPSCSATSAAHSPEQTRTALGFSYELTKAHFSQKTAIYLQERAQFDYLVNLPDNADRAQAIIDAMESIESDYMSLQGILPKAEYQDLDNTVLGQLLRTLNPEELKRASGDVFGRVYEYFLGRFAAAEGKRGGQFYTARCVVQLLVAMLEPYHGRIYDLC